MGRTYFYPGIVIPLLLILSACRSDSEHPLPVIPMPSQWQSSDNTLDWNRQLNITLNDSADNETTELAEYFSETLATKLNKNVSVSRTRIGTSAINIDLQLQSTGSDEGYQLNITEQSVSIIATTNQGLFYGFQTLLQLVDADTLTSPQVAIIDSPRFPYRGVMLDVGRHFYPVDSIKKMLDTMARYKLNKFHWHLTDDQGWRIQIDSYPKLTTIGAYRHETMLEKNFDPYIGDGIPHSGYYSKDEIREVIEYAAKRYIEVIPEIDMPGHMQAAIASYPELGCYNFPVEVSTRWGVHHQILCPSEQTFTFLEAVFTEIIELFPSQFVHVGGDETPLWSWQQSQTTQTFMQQQDLASESEVYGYFIEYIQAFLQKRGKTLIGWDEILDANLDKTSVVMAWQDMEQGFQAAAQGNPVIMTPREYVYFDYYQGDKEQEPFANCCYLPLDKVYAFEPAPDALSAEQAQNIIGAQANLWTEYISTTEYLEYMMWPRTIALSEVLWSSQQRRNWASFEDRLARELEYLKTQHINYRQLN